MATYRKFDFVAEALLDAGDNKVGTFGCLQLFLQIRLVKP